MALTQRPVYDTVVVKGWTLHTFGTRQQLAEYLGPAHQSAVTDVWEALKSGVVTDNNIIANYGGGADRGKELPKRRGKGQYAKTGSLNGYFRRDNRHLGE